MNLRSSFFVLLLLALLTSSSAYAQLAAEEFRAAHGDFFHLLRSDRSDVQLGYLSDSGQKTSRGAAEFDVDQFYGRFELPIPMKRDFFLRAGFDYTARRYEFTAIDEVLTGISDDIFHRGAVLGGAGVFLTDSVLLTSALKLGVFSNFGDGIEGSDFDVRGEAMLVYRLNPGAQLLLGARLSEDFESTSFYPLLGLRLLSEDGRLHINVTLPVEIRVGYNFFQPFQVFGRIGISGERYNYTDGPGGADGELHVQDRRLGGGISLWLGNYVNLELEAGVTLDSSIQIELADTPEIDRDIDNSGYFRAQLGFGF